MATPVPLQVRDAQCDTKIWHRCKVWMHWVIAFSGLIHSAMHVRHVLMSHYFSLVLCGTGVTLYFRSDKYKRIWDRFQILDACTNNNDNNNKWVLKIYKRLWDRKRLDRGKRLGVENVQRNLELRVKRDKWEEKKRGERNMRLTWGGKDVGRDVTWGRDRAGVGGWRANRWRRGNR